MKRAIVPIEFTTAHISLNLDSFVAVSIINFILCTIRQLRVKCPTWILLIVLYYFYLLIYLYLLLLTYLLIF